METMNLQTINVQSLMSSSSTKKLWTPEEVLQVVINLNSGMKRKEACEAVGRTAASYQTCVAPKLKVIYQQVLQLPTEQQGAALVEAIKARFTKQPKSTEE